jgi:hypothetical protein
MSNDKPFTDPQLDGHERFRVSQRNFGVSSDTAKTPIESAVESPIESPNESLLTPCIDIKKTISRLKEFKDSYRDEYDDFHEACDFS